MLGKPRLGRAWRRRQNVGGTAVPIEKELGGRPGQLEPHRGRTTDAFLTLRERGQAPFWGSVPWLLSLVKSTVEFKAQTRASS